MDRIVECVPNFSEGRDKAVIKAITDAIASVPGVHLLDVDPGADTNRTVVTFVGSPEAVKEGAFQGIRKAREVIDMRKHSGAHPRIGACDVCPFVPVRGVSMDDCVALSREVAERVGRELSIPVYMYENSATREEWRNLANVRKGEYEGLQERKGKPEWKPDFGPFEFDPGYGATAIGAREFLIAYNVNLNTKSKKLANDIAFAIREQGRKRKGADGKPVLGPEGEPVYDPGLLKSVKAIGWYIEAYGRAQVSVNLTDYHATPLWKVFEAARDEARKLGLRATGSELVGLIPLEAMLEVGRHYLSAQGQTPGVSDDELVLTAVQSLGLAELAPFNPKERIIEYRIAGKRPLVDMTLYGFLDELASDSPAPGGGSVSALSGAMAAGLASMVAGLTASKKKFAQAHKDMWEAGVEAQRLKGELRDAVDEDTEAFNSVMAASKVKDADAIELASKEAVEVPLSVCRMCAELMPPIDRVVELGNPASVTDGGVAALQAMAACEGAWMNVMINLPGIKDRPWAEKVMAEADGYRAEVKRRGAEITAKVEKKLNGQ